ncbi:MAG TPA: Uma2 family endonuclease [Bryobacteraceae bacterium]|jgi:Uma2 family endonuclease|nr:Uma2 family endonuclease [Bryobacteraceae bacterium]
MAATLVPVEEYVRDLSDSHLEYVDGVLIQKPMPTWMHAVLQAWIAALIMRQYPQYVAGGEVHARLRTTEFRLPDIAVQLREVAQAERYAEHPPILCVEILSPEDRIGAIFAKCEGYHDWGVPVCWVIDPIKWRAWIYERQGEPVLETDYLVASDIRLALIDAFSVLNPAH